MKRPIPLSLDELITKNKKGDKLQIKSPILDRPKFLSKTERAKIDAEKKQKEELETAERKQRDQQRIKEVRQVEREKRKYEMVTKLPDRSKKPVTRRKFQFEWSNDDDTLADYHPIVELQIHGQGKDRETVNLQRHWSEKPLDKMTGRDWRIMKEDYDISSKGTDMENPLRRWEEADISRTILNRIKSLGYREPTPIQRASIPTGLKNRDVIGIAETGSGKTLAYIVPILNYITKLPPLGENEGPYSLILVPTRELALQVEAEFEKFYGYIRFNVASLIGGHSYEENVEKLGNGAEIVIATPGRLIDCMEKRIVGLDRCYFLVLDEADRMIDMGFEEQVNKVLDRLPRGETNPFYFGTKKIPQRTTMMFTATMGESVQKIAASRLTDPVTVMIGESGGSVKSVTEIAIKIPADDNKRLAKLKQILGRRQYRPPVIVFANYKKTCEIIGESLADQGFRPVVMHGSKSQEQREEAIRRLKNGDADILVATDVAGRGIDIPDVSLVVNYQMTKGIEEYTHRIGRTGRAGKRGTAITFWDDDDGEVVEELSVRTGMRASSYVRSDGGTERAWKAI
ncbi:DEKNAAC103998 [Brettanomyces naardenensis]|uniref:RNA helicase n=1 Tax=Brettanomyces naardenensis TaxID=13370 RepID=A0A448YPS9_BRENA|nr:DEKNAAC103998 [Brettanomyces naardenensis]